MYFFVVRQSPEPVTLLKKRLAQLFPFEFCEIFKNIFLQDTSWRCFSFKVFFIVLCDTVSIF